MKALIGFSGFVGSSLIRQIKFDFFYRKSNINTIQGKKFDVTICAGAPAQKWIANKNPNEDLKNINFLTVHAAGGYEMMKIAKKASKKINKKIKILGVTVLTSFSEKSLKKTGHTKSIKKIVIEQSRLAMKAGLDGIICSAHEVKFIRKICKGKMIITPGIRLQGDKVQDQMRVMTPQKAFKNKSDAIVIGRSITEGNIKKNILKLINSFK